MTVAYHPVVTQLKLALLALEREEKVVPPMGYERSRILVEKEMLRQMINRRGRAD